MTLLMKGLHRPEIDALVGRRLAIALAIVLAASVAWGLQTNSWWVAIMNMVVSGLPLWWSAGSRESPLHRFAQAITQGGAIAAVYLLYGR